MSWREEIELKSIKELDDELCNYCEWNLNGNINTNQFNMCEGRNCKNAYNYYLENIDILKDNKLDEYEKQIEILQDKLDRIASYISDIYIPDKSVNWDDADEAIYNIRGDLEDIIYEEAAE